MTRQPIAQFVGYLNSLEIQVFLERNGASPERLRCTAPEGTLTPELRQELADRKAELIAFLSQKNSTEPLPPTAAQSFPLSFAQQRLWFLHQLTPDNPFYNVPAAIHLTGTLDQTALERSFQEIVRRHAALRTTFVTRDGDPVQIIKPQAEVKIDVIDLHTIAIPDRERISQRLITTEAQHPFDLTQDLLLRVTLIKFSPTEAVLLLTLHHIVADGWSLGVLIRELACSYTAFVEGRSPDLPPLSMQYTDFVAWQRRWLQGEILESQLDYWRKQLQDLPVLQLPSDRPRPGVQTYRGATYPLQIPAALTQALIDLSQQSGASLFMTLLAAFQTLLYRYTGQEDIAIGSPIANRHRSELEALIGFFVNSLVLRSKVSGNLTFRQLLEQVRDVALEAYQHQDLPFEKLVESLEPDRDLSRNPLFQVAFALQNAPMQTLELPGLTLKPAPLESGSTRFDLEVHLWEPSHGLQSLWRSQEGLSGFISYSTDLFDRDTVGRLIGHFQTLLEGIVSDPDTRLSRLPLLTTTERQQVLVDWNQTAVERSNDQCFHHVFEAQVQAHPTAIALVSEQASFTYQEINQQADSLAQLLQQKNIQPNDLVGLCVDRSADMVIGILGILKAGAAYVPIDPNYPSDRIQFILTDTQVSIVLTQSWIVEKLPRSSAYLLCLDQPLPLNLEPYQAPPLTADYFAYLIYTSGSTGTPKGVLSTHRGLCNVVEAQRSLFHLSCDSRILQFSSLSFDASIFEIALAFASGGTLYIPPQPAQQPGMALIQFLNDHAITHALITPAALAVLPEAQLPALQVLITGGEACSSQVVDRWAGDRHFFNAYGLTETTIWTTIAELHPGDDPATIGRPIQNTQAYILDSHLNPVPVGIPGELYVGGEGLSWGYLNRSELTAERFLVNPFFRQEKEIPDRIYKTGDRAQFQSDGTIKFLGRIDNQVKLRGFRVELGEIEAILQRHPAICEAVVLSANKSPHATRLVTYFSLDLHHFQQAQSLQTQRLQHWQTLYNQTYQVTDSVQTSTSSSAPFNVTGWNSSYTGAPIPLEEMQEWVSDRVQLILALRPKRVLEIGCGTGLLLFQIAPHCEQYVGTDFSIVSLESLQNQLTHLPQVELLHRLANDFEGIDMASFDVVILNSVVQYFPSQDYLLQVIEKALQALTIGGTLFVGDVRSLPLLRAFHTWAEFCRADAIVERDMLRQRVERSYFEETELTIDPALFKALCNRFPKIQQVQVYLARGQAHNEMTQFRYNVLLHTKRLPDSQGRSPSLLHHNWKLQPLTVSEIQQQLQDTEPEQWMITNITNSRLNKAIQALNWIDSKSNPKTVGRMRELLQDSTELAIDPQQLWNLETTVSYSVEITWSAQPDVGSYDVLLTRHGMTATNAFDQFKTPQPPDLTDDRYTNEPLQSQFAHQIISELRQHVKQTLPDYMVPSVFIPLASLPLTVSGKVDRTTLAQQSLIDLVDLESLNNDSTDKINSAKLPLTQTESTLTHIWKDLLRLKQVNVHDNFFELGGHSLLATQMTSRIRDSFKLELPLQKVFETPTIAQLAAVIETLSTAPPTLKAPPIVRLDRVAYRRQESPPIPIPPKASQVLNPQTFSQTETAPPLTTATRSPLVPLTLSGSKQPFFCIHPMFGVVFPYLELAQNLEMDRSFYGLQPLGLDGTHPPLTSIPAIATYYIQAIQTLQPQGPYFLGGWSFGGLVAFEMAQQLTQAGQEVALLALLDTAAPNQKLTLNQSLKFLFRTALWSTLPFILDFSAIAADRVQNWNWLSRWQWSAIGRQIPEVSRLQLLDESAIAPLLRIVYANAQAAQQYQPKPYTDRMVLFRATEQSSNTQKEPTLGWYTLVNDIKLHHVQGNHLSFLKQPYVQTLAQQLRHYL
jgi:amino acid adenylation domain-containing protein